MKPTSEDCSVTDIHTTAIVHPDAELGVDVQVEPYAVIHERTRIGDRCRIGASSVVNPGVSMGEGNQVFEHVVLGGPPQDRAFDPDCPTGVEIGANNRFREFVTVHRSTREDEPTRIGSDCLFMFSTHIAHDCVVEDEVTIAGYTALSGHVEVGMRAFISGHVLVHQFTRIGRLSMVSPMTGVRRDVLPFFLLGREPPVHCGLNRVGLKRAGIEGERYRELEAAWRVLRDGGKPEELADGGEQASYLKAWLSAPSERGHYAFLRPGARRGPV